MPKSKTSAFLSVVLVFASGAAMGAVGYRLYEVKTVSTSSVPPSKKEMTPDEYRKLVVTHLKNAVKLTDEQVGELQKIYDWQGEQFAPLRKKTDAESKQVRKDFDQGRQQIHDAAVAKIKAILTPDQQPLYEKYLADRAAEQKKRQLEQEQQGKGPHKDGHRPPQLP